MKSRILALDYGSARIGIALSDERKVLASPVGVFEAKRGVKALAASLLDHAAREEYEIETIVVGLPLLLNGTQGSQAEEVLRFVERLKGELSAPIALWDERLTTAQADRAMKEAEMTRKQRARIADQVAAVIILQSYLDAWQKNL